MKKAISLLALISLCLKSQAQVENCLKLDGNDNYIYMGDVNDLGSSNFTIECWFNIESYTSNGNKIINKGLTTVGSPYNSGYGLRIGYFAPNQLDFSFHGTSSTFGASGNSYNLIYDDVAIGQWYHVAAVRRLNKLLLYVNGELEDEHTIPLDFNINTNMPFSLGAIDKGGLSSNNHFHDGMIDEVRIWNEAKGQAQIQEFMNCKIDSPQPYLIACYNLDSEEGTTVFDVSGNANHGDFMYSAEWVYSPKAHQCLTEVFSNLDLNVPIKIYPNPSSNFIQLLQVNQDVIDYEIFNANGEILIKGKYNGSLIDIQKIKSGTYILRLYFGDEVQTLKFVKQ